MVGNKLSCWTRVVVAGSISMVALAFAIERVAAQEIEPDPAAFNIVFGLDPGEGNYDGIVGESRDTWNLIDVGQTKIEGLRCDSGERTTVDLKVSENDGEWGIPDHKGVFHAYIYHNNQAVDLTATLTGLKRGQYRVYVYAHGDAPNQNANIELSIGDESLGSKATLNDGTWDFRSPEFKEGVQFVSFEFSIVDGEPIKLTSKRDGSNYSMFNAIQVVRLMH